MKKHEGAVGGLYVGTEYGMERIRGRRDWVIKINIFFHIKPHNVLYSEVPVTTFSHI
jgi:hypothetical protein